MNLSLNVSELRLAPNDMIVVRSDSPVGCENLEKK